MGQTRLGGSFVIRVLQLYSLLYQFRLGGSRRGFSSSSSVSSLITHLGVILFCISLPYSLSFHYIVDDGRICLRIVLSVHCAYLLLFHTLFKLE